MRSEDLFVPALFAQWVDPLMDCASVLQGQRVLDVPAAPALSLAPLPASSARTDTSPESISTPP